jgi:short-subunit dehydrogenase
MSERERAGLQGQTVIVIGGSAGMGLETAIQARAESADVILTGRNQEKLTEAATIVGTARTASFRRQRHFLAGLLLRRP